jgi:hypothetical protein
MLWATRESTSSQDAPDGNSPSISQAGKDQSGADQPLASPSPQPGKGKARKTSGTSGPSSSSSSPQSALLSSLGNKWLQRMGWPGSMEYKTTLKERITPSGRSILALRATGSRTSGKGSTGELVGWCSPTAMDCGRGGLPPRPHDTGIPLTQQVGLAGWPTPNALEFGCLDTERVERRRQECKERTGNGNGFGLTLGQAVQLNIGGRPTPTSLSFNESHAPGNNRSMNKTVELVSGWPSPDAHRRGEYSDPDKALQRVMNKRTNPNASQVNLQEMVQTTVGWASPKTKDWKAPALKSYRERGGGAKGEDLNAQVSSNAGTERPAGLALNPAMSRWLMHFPSSWDHCSPGWKSWQEGQQALKDWHESSGATAPAGLKPTETPSPSPAQ